MDPNKANQIAIAKNNGTIHIHNHVNDNADAIKTFYELEKLKMETVREFITSIKEVANSAIKSGLLKKKKQK